MKTLTKKFRAIVFDGVVQEGWQEEQTGETLVSDLTQAFEADTLDEILCILVKNEIDINKIDDRQLNLP